MPVVNCESSPSQEIQSFNFEIFCENFLYLLPQIILLRHEHLRYGIFTGCG